MESSFTIGEGDGEPFAFSLKISHAAYELNVHLREDEVALFRDVPAARWDDRTTCRIGTSANASVYWSTEKDGVSILVGHDDETGTSA